MRVMQELRGTEEVREKGIVVETPYAVRARWFEEIEGLYSSGQGEVCIEYDEDHGFIVRL